MGMGIRRRGKSLGLALPPLDGLRLKVANVVGAASPRERGAPTFGRKGNGMKGKRPTPARFRRIRWESATRPASPMQRATGADACR
jgi:hypothetical protein